MGTAWSLPNLSPGGKHAEVRKMLRRAIGPQRVAHHDPAIEKCAARMVLKLQDSTGDPSQLILGYAILHFVFTVVLTKGQRSRSACHYRHIW